MTEQQTDETKQTNPVKAIRAHCVECMGGCVAEVPRCTSPRCKLFPFRMGKNPYRRKRALTHEEGKALVLRLQPYRQAAL